MYCFGQPLSCHLVTKFSSIFSLKELKVHRILVLVITYLTFLTYLVSRRSLSIVKPVLNHRNCSELLDSGHNGTETDPYWCDWEPFKGPGSRSLLGTLDLVFMVSYSVSMYINGMIAERMNLRYFLTIGMIFGAVCNVLFGIAYYLDIHSLGYFYAIQVLTGISHSTGWPAVMSSVANWFGSAKSGLIFGIWNSHMFVGDIVGSAIAGYYVDYDWGLSFIIPGLVIGGTALVVFLFLIPKPEEVGSVLAKNSEQSPVKTGLDNTGDVQSEATDSNSAISIIEALKIPGVIEFGICLFFVKLVTFTFLDWLPYYISHTTNLSNSEAAYMTMLYDVGGIVGGIFVGFLADRTRANAIISICMLIFAIPSLGLYYLFGNVSKSLNLFLLFVTGLFVTAPKSLITTAVSAELGSKVPSKSALATVAAIINATDSMGSAVGPPLAGYVSEFGWDYVFILVMASDLCALICIVRIGINDCKRILSRRKLTQN